MQLYWKETPIQVFFCEIYEIFKNTFIYRTPPVADSVWLHRAKTHTEPSQTSKMELFTKRLNGWKQVLEYYWKKGGANPLAIHTGFVLYDFWLSVSTCIRSSRSVVFCEKGALKNLPILTGKHFCLSLLKACNFIKKRIQLRNF